MSNCRRLVAAIVLLGVSSHLALAAVEEKSEAKEALAEALASPPEFAADFLLRLVENNGIPARDQQAEVLEQVILLSSQAPEPLPRASMSGGPVDSRAGYFSLGYGLRVDQLSLRLRATVLLARLDKRRAWQLLEETALPALPPIACSAPLVYDFAPAYANVGTIVTALAGSKEPPPELLAPWLRVRTPEQIAPAARMLFSFILSSTLSRERLEELLWGFASSVSSIPFSPRSSGYAVQEEEEAIEALAKYCKSHQIGASALVTAYREYLSHQLAGGGCADDREAASRARRLAFFNDGLRGVIGEDAKTIAALDVEPVQQAGGAAEIAPYWQSPATESILTGLKYLNFWGGTRLLSEAERRTPEWAVCFHQTLNDIDAWTQPDGMPRLDFYGQKAMGYMLLAGETTAPELQTIALDRALQFINLNSDLTPRVFWIVPLDALFKRAQWKTPGGDALFERIQHSATPVVAMYARLLALTRKPLPPGEKR